MSAEDQSTDRQGLRHGPGQRPGRTGRALAIVSGALLLLSASPSVAEPSSATASPSLVFAGAGSHLPIVKRLVEEFGRVRPEVRIQVPPSIGSGGGARAAGEGAIALGLISRPLREQEKRWGLTVVPYARTAIVIGAHPTVADAGLTSDQLLQIYRGTKTRWQDGREIIVLTREPGDSSIEVLGREVAGFREVYAESQRAKRWVTVMTDQEMTRLLTRTPYAIGLSDVGAITTERLAIKALRLNGTPPTPDNVLNGAYRFVKVLRFAFLPDRVPPGALAFVEFVRSTEGARILKASGYLPAE